MRRLCFSLLVGLASRLLMLRDRLLGRPSRLRLDQNPAVSFVRLRLPSGRNLLDASLVTPLKRPPRASLLICHGIGETIDHWFAVQKLLADSDISSLVFNYSGFGKSTGRVDAEQCEIDARAAFHLLQHRTPSLEISILGFSLGTGIAAAIANSLSPKYLILCAGYTSFRQAARSLGAPRFLAWCLPAVWKTEEVLRQCTIPTLILHSDGDRSFPSQMAKDLAAACASPCDLILVSAISHNAPVYNPQLPLWSLITDRL